MQAESVAHLGGHSAQRFELCAGGQRHGLGDRAADQDFVRLRSVFTEFARGVDFGVDLK